MKGAISLGLDLFRLVAWLACAAAGIWLLVTRLLAGDLAGFAVGLVLLVVAYAVLMLLYAAGKALVTSDEEYRRVKAENERILGRG